MALGEFWGNKRWAWAAKRQELDSSEKNNDLTKGERMGNKIRKVIFGIIFCLAARTVFCSQVPQLVVYGQPVVLSGIKIQNNSIYLAADNPILKQIAAILGEKFKYDPSQNQIMVVSHHHYSFIFPSGLVLHGVGIPFIPHPLLSRGQWYYPLNSYASAFHASLVSSPEQNRWYLDPTILGMAVDFKKNAVKLEVHSSNRIEPNVKIHAKQHEITGKIPSAFLSSKVTPPTPPIHSFITKISFYQYHVAPNVVGFVIHFQPGTVNWNLKSNHNGTKFSLKFSYTGITKGIAAVKQPILKQLFQPQPQQKPVGTVLAQAPSTAYPPPTSLTGIHFKTGKKGQFEAVVRLSGSTPYVWHQLKPPDNRFFIDFLDTTKNVEKGLRYKSSLLNKIRLAQFQAAPVPVTRLVFAPYSPIHVFLKDTRNGIRISLYPVLQKVALKNLGNLTGEGFTSILPETAPLAAFKRNHITIALDPGHGGEDTGAIGPGGLEEKNVTLDVGLRLRALLKQDGFHVVMTRTTDTECLGYQGTAVAELQCRANVANYDHAALFMAIHINASYYPWVHGVSTWWYKPMDKPLAQFVQNSLAKRSGFLNLGIRKAPFYVLRHTFMPAVLVELGFITNLKDEHKLENPDFREKLAEILNQGIENYVRASLTHSHSNF